MAIGLGLALSLSQQRTGVSAFSPATLFAASEVGVWHDPSDLATVWQDSARTVPGAVDAVVGCIDDKSGNGKHATQATTASKPILRQVGALYYLEFDGFDDFLATASISFTATSKVSMFAGIRKNNDTVGIVAELSASISANAGTFNFAINNAVKDWDVLARGAAALNANQGTWITETGAVTAVVSSAHDIPGDLTTIRKNGTAGANGTGDKGTGNFGNFPLYIGRRGGVSEPANMRFYGLIVRGAETANPSPTEQWLAAKTGVSF